MDPVGGAPPAAWSEGRSAAYAALLADLHRVGAGHEPRAVGPDGGSFAAVWPEAGEIAAPLLASPLVESGAVGRALALIGATEVPPLPRTRVHGDARLCHAFFEGDRPAGLIDCEEGAVGERLLDLAYGAVSHPDPALGAWPGFDEIRDVARRYDAPVGLTGEERGSLPAALAYACLEQLGSAVSFLEGGRTGVDTADVSRAVKLLDRLASG